MTVQVHGVGELLAKLRDLDKRVRRKILRKAVNEPSKIVLAAMKAKVPVETGLLRKSLGRKVKVWGNGVAFFIVGPRRGFKKQVKTKLGKMMHRNPSKYAHLADKFRPWRGPVADQTKTAVLASMERVLKEELAKL